MISVCAVAVAVVSERRIRVGAVAVAVVLERRRKPEAIQ